MLKQLVIESEAEFEECSICGKMKPILTLTRENEIDYCYLCDYCDKYHCKDCNAYLHKCRKCGYMSDILYVHYDYSYEPGDYAYCQECFYEIFNENDFEYAHTIGEFI